MFKTLVSLLYGHASYYEYTDYCLAVTRVRLVDKTLQTFRGGDILPST